MKLSFFAFIFWLLFIVGYIMNIVKFVNSDFKPSYKREIVHGIGVFAIGGILGWLHIPDTPQETEASGNTP